MGKRQRTKGHNWEREVAKWFQPIYPEAKRGIGQARDSREVPDVQGTPFWVECKVGERPNIPAAYVQAEEARDDRPSLVVTRKNAPHASKKPLDLVTMDVQTFFELLLELRARGAAWPFFRGEEVE